MMEKTDDGEDKKLQCVLLMLVLVLDGSSSMVAAIVSNRVVFW